MEVKTGRAIRIAPKLDVRERAVAFVPNEPRHYFAQMQAYQSMSDEDMLTTQEVLLTTPIEQIASRSGIRINCDVCGEEIMNEREVHQDGLTVCRSCIGNGYYQTSLTARNSTQNAHPELLLVS
jgi:formylmethanofuran dehydrogenase subunit E